MQYPDNRLLIFTKPPLPGRTKTRLIPALGALGAARLQERLSRRLLRDLSGHALCPLELWAAFEPEHHLFQELSQEHGVPVYLQQGDDLGARMAHAAQQALARAQRVILIGTDCPLLGGEQIQSACRALEQYPAVLGPVEDGGYALLGLREHAPLLFSDMPWSTHRVAELTRQRMRTLSWNWAELPTLWDLDRPADLRRLRNERPELLVGLAMEDDTDQSL